jgi:hypothetical protein
MGDIRRVTLPLGEEPAVRVESTIPPPPSRHMPAEEAEESAPPTQPAGATDGNWVRLQAVRDAVVAFETKHPTLVYLVADIRKALES